MSTLNVTRNYADGEVLTQADLDAFLDDIETFVNITKLNDDNLQNNGITGSSKLLTGSVTAGKLATDSVTTIKIADANVTSAKLADDSVTTVKILDANVTSAKIASSTITESNMAPLSVGTPELIDASVTEAKLALLSVGTPELIAASVTTAKIASATITPANMANRYLVGASSTVTLGVSGTLSLGNFTVTTDPVLYHVYGGTFVSNSTTGHILFDLQYSSDNVSWSTLKRIADINVTSNTGTPTTTFNRLAFDGSNNPNSNIGSGAVIGLHSPSAGTAYYRVINSSASVSMVISEAITALFTQLTQRS